MPNAPSLTNPYPTITNSDALYERALPLIPAGTQTLAKGTTQYVQGIAPKYLARGKGAHVWDVDGNEYIDYQMGIGPIVLGYAYPAVDDAIRAQLDNGITFSMMHPLEVEVAELLCDMVPGIEMVRYSKTGCDVTSAAVRVARAYTGRQRVVCCGYHGWHDWYISVTSRRAGIPDEVAGLTSTFEYNDLTSLAASIDEDTACVIMEPIVFATPQPGFIEAVRALCTERGVVLIFDEMWTGFRIAPGGAQEFFGIEADLVCYSKAIANGMPLSVLAGKKDLMRLLDRDVFFFTTFGGEALSLAAACATLTTIRKESVVGHLHLLGMALRDAFNAIAHATGMTYAECIGLGCRSMISLQPSAADPLLMKSFIQQELFKRGILWSGFHTMSYSHTQEDVDHTLAAYREVLPMLHERVLSGNVEEGLRGLAVEPVFRKTGNFNTKPRRAS